MRMAELGKHVGDINAALEDFQNVQRLCERFPANNEQTLISALFHLGKLYLDKQDINKATDYFRKCTAMLDQKLRG